MNAWRDKRTSEVRLIIFFPTISFETKLIFYSRKLEGESALVLGRRHRKINVSNLENAARLIVCT